MGKGWYKLGDGSRIYGLGNGKLATGYISIEGKYYYFNKEGVVQTYKQTINGEPYYFFSDGSAMGKGWYKLGDGSRIYGLGNGKLAVGIHLIDGVLSTFDSSGILVKSESNYEISGESTVTTQQMVFYYKSSGKTYPSDVYAAKGAATIEDFCQIYYEEAEAECIRAEVAFCQVMKETGWLRFGGDVKPEQCNFAGIGATGGGATGAVFSDVRTGARAHIQHLKAYANTDALVNPCVDPRFNLVKRGCAPYVEWLGKGANPQGYGWAPAATYGTNILDMIKDLKNVNGEILCYNKCA